MSKTNWYALGTITETGKILPTVVCTNEPLTVSEVEKSLLALGYKTYVIMPSES